MNLTPSSLGGCEQLFRKLKIENRCNFYLAQVVAFHHGNRATSKNLSSFATSALSPRFFG